MPLIVQPELAPCDPDGGRVMLSTRAGKCDTRKEPAWRWVATSSSAEYPEQPWDANLIPLDELIRQMPGAHPIGSVDELRCEAFEADEELEEFLEQALALYRDLGDQRGQAGALTFLGVVRLLTGSYLGAARDLGQALALCRDLGDRGGEAEVLNEDRDAAPGQR